MAALPLAPGGGKLEEERTWEQRQLGSWVEEWLVVDHQVALGGFGGSRASWCTQPCVGCGSAAAQHLIAR